MLIKKKIAKPLFKDISKKNLEFNISNFYDKFISSKFKRKKIPDSPKIFSFNLSPTGLFRVPLDIKNPY